MNLNISAGLALSLSLVGCGFDDSYNKINENTFDGIEATTRTDSPNGSNPVGSVEETGDEVMTDSGMVTDGDTNNDKQDNVDLQVDPDGATPSLGFTDRVWIEAWNTDPYSDDCVVLVEGVAVVESSCSTQYKIVCETSCQATASSPQQCGTSSFQYFGSEQKMTYDQGRSFCESQGLVMLEYNIFKVPSFSAK